MLAALLKMRSVFFAFLLIKQSIMQKGCKRKYFFNTFYKKIKALAT